MTRRGWGWACLILVLAVPAVSCSPDPLGPVRDPLLGTWKGEFERLDHLFSTSQALVVTVASGGRARGTGYDLYTSQGQTVIEQLFVDLDVAPDGASKGTASYLFEIQGEGLFYAVGSLEGTFAGNSFEGTITFPGSPDYVMDVRLTRAGGP